MKQQPADYPGAAVTIEEALAKLIGYEGAAVPVELLLQYDEDEWTDESEARLSALNRKLDFCTVEDALNVRIEVLTDLHKHQSVTDCIDDSDKCSNVEALKNAIDILEFKSELLDYIRSHLQNDLRRNPACIKRVPSPTGIKRFEAASIARWAREEREIDVSEWYDISDIDLFAEKGAFPEWIDVQKEQLSAHFDVLDCLLRFLLLLKPTDLNGKNRLPSTEWRGALKNNGEINKSQIIAFIKHQFDPLEFPENSKLPSKDTCRERLDDWHRYYLTGLTKCRPGYTEDSIKYTQMIIAGLAIGLDEDAYGELLADHESAPWPVPRTVLSVLTQNVWRVNEQTIRAVLERSIACLMQAVRDPE